MEGALMTQIKPASAIDERRADFKALYRKIETVLGRIEHAEDPSTMLSEILESLITGFREELGFEHGRLYSREGKDFRLFCRFGSDRGAPIGFRVPPDYPPHRRTLEEGLLIMKHGDPGFDDAIEDLLGVGSTFAAIAVGKGNTHVIAFSISGEIREENILYSLSAVRHVVNLRLEQQKFSGILEESRAIQESLLPAAPPQLDGYVADGRSRPTEIVGGDVFDYLRLTDTLFGVTIADASGHGLPAALLARDVITGLRMGVGPDLKVGRVIERLNEVIHRAALSSKFISLFYGEFDRDGTLIYCNAGHNPPLLQRESRFRTLDRGGLVLGPNPAARYERGYVRMRPGDRVVMYTDGLVECEDRAGNPFGLRRFRNVLRETRDRGVAETLDTLFAAVDRHAGRGPQADDITAVIVQRL
jgi:sigma-B regulation protein RsbU (phosphoserine phosphatase)